MFVIGLDFDGTVTSHEFPKIGKDIGAVPVLKKLTEKGVRICLNTMRDRETLQEAVNWFKENEIPLWGINKNPSQFKWTTSPKVHADIYIDDMALGAPLKFDKNISDRPFIDWALVENYFKSIGIL